MSLTRVLLVTAMRKFIYILVPRSFVGMLMLIVSLCSLPSAPSIYQQLHISALQGSVIKSVAPAPTKKAAAAAADDDFDDMFGDDEELNEDGETAAEARATAARRERMAKAAALKAEADAKAGKKKKEKEAEKSLVVLEVKPWEADTDLEMVWNEIKKFTKEGLAWGEVQYWTTNLFVAAILAALLFDVLYRFWSTGILNFVFICVICMMFHTRLSPHDKMSLLFYCLPLLTNSFATTTPSMRAEFQAGARGLRHQEARDDLLDCGQHDCHGRYHRCHRGARGLRAVRDRGVHEQDLSNTKRVHVDTVAH